VAAKDPAYCPCPFSVRDAGWACSRADLVAWCPTQFSVEGSDASVQPYDAGQDRSGLSLASRTRCHAWSAISKAEREREQFERPGVAAGKQVPLDQPIDEQSRCRRRRHRRARCGRAKQVPAAPHRRARCGRAKQVPAARHRRARCGRAARVSGRGRRGCEASGGDLKHGTVRVDRQLLGWRDMRRVSAAGSERGRLRRSRPGWLLVVCRVCAAGYWDCAWWCGSQFGICCI
jgi:hypothetical protein